MSRVSPPDIDPRTASLIFNRLRAMAPHYTREWAGKDDGDPGIALLKIFSFLAQGVVQRLNRAPERHFLCFLDMLGIRLLPKTPAIVPVRFLVAQGATESILVRSGTQMAAPATAEHPDELPFETTQDLQVVPAALSALLAVDPARDVILKPPPGFLELQVVPALPPEYRVEAFSSAGTRALQLDRVNQLEKGDFLRVQVGAAADAGTAADCCSAAPTPEASAIHADHLIVSDVKGNIVFVTDPLPRDYDAGTLVQKLVQFDLTNGRNFQEHILYLAHSDLFNIKSKAIFTLLFTQAAGTGSNLDPLRIEWEFFGVLEDDREKVEGWHPLNVDSDGTTGLSSNGEIQLSKTAGEIKETEINGNKSRWIRARLTDAILPRRALPLIESVVLRVKAAAEGILADLAFHNETPEPAALSFNPFGIEPRIFDRFSLASKEAFSKRGADVILDIKLDNVDLLASPVGIYDEKTTGQNGIYRIFAHGAAGRLLEFRIDPLGATVSPAFVNHLKPSNTRITAGSIPAAVLSQDQVRVGVFVRADDKKIYLRLVVGTDKAAWQWIPLDSPAQSAPAFNPAAVLEGANWRVYTTADGQLYSRTVPPGNPGSAAPWTLLASPNIVIASSPFVDGGWIFVTDDQGKAYRHDGANWASLNVTGAKNSRPCAKVYSAGTQAKVFLRSPQGGLLYVDTGTNAIPLPAPPVPLASDPAIAEAADGTLTVYARGEDHRLWWIEPDSIIPVWDSRIGPSETNLAGDPFTISNKTALSGTAHSVFSSTETNSLVEWRDELGLDQGQLQAGPSDLVFLETAADLSGMTYIHILAGSAHGDFVKIVDPGSATPTILALLETPLSEVSDSTTEYELLKSFASGNVVGFNAGNGDVDLASATGIDPNLDNYYLLIRDQFRQIVSLPGGDLVKTTEPWDTDPQASDPYVVLKASASKHARSGANLHVILAASASPTDNEYQDFFVTIHAQGGDIYKRIVAYTGATKLAKLNNPLASIPAKATAYQITQGNPIEGWLEYQDPDQTELRPELSWEYWNGNGWVRLNATDNTSRLLVGQTVTFQVPEDIVNTEVAGQDNFWIRARIVGGDYGRELFEVVHDLNDPSKPDQIRIKKDPIRPPFVKSLRISYSFSENLDPRICLTFNNLSYLDQTAANSTDDKYFVPFQSLPGTRPAVYFGFDQPFHSGPVRLYADTRELEVDEQNKPGFVWTFETDNQWKAVTAEDEAEAFTKPGIITWNLPGVLDEREHFGRELNWVRAVLEKGAWNGAPVLNGLFPNAAMASQFQTYRNEFIGPSDGTANQTFRLTHPSVMKGIELRIREVLTDDEHKQLIEAEGEDAVFTTLDVRGQALERWVRWREVEEFSNSIRTSRHFRLDPEEGEIEFGDGIHGRIPPAGGDNIQVFKYQAGGGAAGNVLAGEVISLISSVAGIDSVINPIDAGGGSEAATPEEMLEIGPAEISHRFRAVTPEDFEWLAKEASRQVRKARCIPDRNAQGRREAGWVTVYVVPDSAADTPLPNVQLRRVVRRHLMRFADLNIVGQDHIYVSIPQYVTVAVEVTVFARSLDDVARAELNVKSELKRFLHPLTGGPEKKGWEFGRGLTVYDICRLLEDIEEVDHLGPIILHFSGKQSAARADVGPNALIASGEHLVTTTVA